MIFTIANSKGGVGKTSLAAAIAKVWTGYGVATNETFSLWHEIIDAEERFMQISPLESFPDFATEQIDVMFDLSGDVTEQSHSIVSAVSQSNVVVVPTIPDRQAIYATAQYILTIAPINPNIIVVANQLQKQAKESFNDWSESYDFKMIQQLLNDALGFTPTILPIKQTNAFKAIYKNNQSIPEMMADNKLLEMAYKEANDQIQAIMNEIQKYG
ncbi:MAG: ParA family protein [Thiotrichales bacterium]|nr:ParA family protein [Thiotrichales bacterium]